MAEMTKKEADKQAREGGENEVRGSLDALKNLAQRTPQRAKTRVMRPSGTRRSR